MNKLDRNYDDYQAIEIIDKKLIKDFIEKHLPIWEERGMKESFLNEMIEPKYKACSKRAWLLISSLDNIILPWDGIYWQ